MKTNKSIIKARNKTELCLAYGWSYDTLRKVLNRKTLKEKLDRIGYVPTMRIFTPKEIECIVDEIGPPEYYTFHKDIDE